MIRKYTPFLYGRNMSGTSGVTLRPGMILLYIGPVYFGLNIHPNRLRQIIKGPRL